MDQPAHLAQEDTAFCTTSCFGVFCRWMGTYAVLITVSAIIAAMFLPELGLILLSLLPAVTLLSFLETRFRRSVLRMQMVLSFFEAVAWMIPIVILENVTNYLLIERPKLPREGYCGLCILSDFLQAFLIAGLFEVRSPACWLVGRWRCRVVERGPRSRWLIQDKTHKTKPTRAGVGQVPGHPEDRLEGLHRGPLRAGRLQLLRGRGLRHSRRFNVQLAVRCVPPTHVWKGYQRGLVHAIVANATLTYMNPNAPAFPSRRGHRHRARFRLSAPALRHGPHHWHLSRRPALLPPGHGAMVRYYCGGRTNAPKCDG